MNQVFHIKKSLIAILIVSLGLLLAGCKSTTGGDSELVTITFNTGVEDLVIEDIEGIPGRNVKKPTDPVREGYTFGGWFDKDGNAVSLNVFPSESLTVYANWRGTTLRSIQFITNSSEYVSSIQLYAGEEIPELPSLQYFEVGQNVHVFQEWQYNSVPFELETMPDHDLVLYAYFSSGEHVIFFDTESDVTIDPIQITIGEEVDAPEISLEKEGAIFMGWQYNGSTYVFNEMPNERITVTPHWFYLNNSSYNQETSLPKLFINLEENTPLTDVTREEYVESSITLYNGDEDDIFGVGAKFKGRGNGSWIDSGPKRGYRIKFNDKLKPMDEKKSKHWVLLAGANFYDPTLLKTKLAFDMADELFTDLEYVSSAHHVELYVNGEYRGIYILAEHIRVQNNRVEIESDFGVLDTGYLIEYDTYANQTELGIDYFMVDGFQYGFTIKSPDSDDYLEEGVSEAVWRDQVEFIEDYTTETLQAALNAPSNPSQYDIFKENADVNSFVDMYILHELFKNTDTGWSSFYMYKKPGGKLYAGAPWDFDAVAGTNRGNQTPYGIYVGGSVAYESESTASELYLSLVQVPEFQSLVEARYLELYDDIILFINNEINDQFLTENQVAFGQNFYFWSVNRNIEGMLGTQYSTYSSLTSAESGWVSESGSLKNWLLARANWLKSEWS